MAISTKNDIQLNNGQKIPAIGFGTYLLRDVEINIKSGINMGYRFIDTAYSFNNETEIGNAIRDKIKDGTVKREDLFIVDKVGSIFLKSPAYLKDMMDEMFKDDNSSEKYEELSKINIDYASLFLNISYDNNLREFVSASQKDVGQLWNTQHRPEDVVPSIKMCLKNLQLDYLDTYIMHWPVAFENKTDDKAVIGVPVDIPIEETWRAMEQCVKLGYTKSIGVSNFNSDQIERVLNIAEIKPVMNQIECNPYFMPKKLIEYCKNNNIAVVAYSPFFGKYGGSIFLEPVLRKIAEKYNKTVSKIIMRYLLHNGVIPVTKSDKPLRMMHNIHVFDFELSQEDIEAINELNGTKRYNDGEAFSKYEEYPFTAAF